MSDMAEFETERLYLRGVTRQNIPAYERYFVDYDVISQLSAKVPWPYPREGVREFLERFIFPRQGKDRWLWGLFLKTNPDELIGSIDLWRPGTPENRGFWLGRQHWGKGLMTEAVAPVTDYAFKVLGFEKLVFSNAVGNTRSRRIKEKTGARLIAVAPAVFVNPQYTEQEVWELTQEEWLRNPTHLKKQPSPG